MHSKAFKYTRSDPLGEASQIPELDLWGIRATGKEKGREWEKT